MGRSSVRFLHYSIEDEEHYRKYGEFPQTDDKDPISLPPPPPPIYDRYNRDFHYNNNNNPNNRQRDTEPVIQPGPFPPNNGYRSNYGEFHFSFFVFHDNRCDFYTTDHSFMSPRDFHRRDEFVNGPPGLKRPLNNGERYGDGFKRFCNGNDDDQPDIMAVIR